MTLGEIIGVSALIYTFIFLIAAAFARDTDRSLSDSECLGIGLWWPIYLLKWIFRSLGKAIRD